MAANKFATMLHRNTNKPTLVLVYALLEWILIVLLLLNSLFSYLILKFADYFGLERPCICCSRIEHFIEPGNCTNKSRFRDLVCESHASEISKLGYCYNHRKLAESEDMCEDCSSSSSSLSSELDCVKISKSFAFYPWMKQNTVMIQDTDDRNDVKCSCCGVHLESRLCAPCFMVKPLDHTQILQNLITQGVDGIEVDAEIDDECDRCRSDSAFDHHEDGDQNSQETMEEAHKVSNVDQPCEQKSEEIPLQHLEFFIHGDSCNLIPLELIDSSSSATPTETQSRRHRYMVAEGTEPDDRNEDVILDFDMLSGGAETEPVFENWHTSGDSVIDFSRRKRKPKSQSISDSLAKGNLERNVGSSMEEKPGNHNLEAHHVENREASEEVTEIQGDGFETEVSIGTEIPDHEQVDEYQIRDIILQEEDSNNPMQEDPSTSLVRFHVQDDTGGDKDEDFVEFQTMSFETSIPKVLRSHLESSLEFNESEAEKIIPDTPTSEEMMKESGTEESLDGSSTISDIEAGELTVEKLKSSLKAERKALSSVYAELEEERSASAVAANQTMALINRLQEEKAAMQMEALQYQRMMEEQSEYDQEELQLLNDLMVKREKEKQDLERELEAYRKKVQELEEVKEKSMMSRRDTNITNSNSSSVSCSNEEDSDGLSVDLNQEAKKENGFYSKQNTDSNTPVDGVLYLEESLANFEEERLSILEQLKVLEKKLVVLNHEDVCHHENGNGYYKHVNGFEDGHNSHIKNGERKTMGQKGKRLLPLFDDAIGKEENGMVMDLNSPENISMEESDLEEEFDDVYERLQALEADREFLKHCISSMGKGDKGLHLLQEILQYLHDLRNVDLRVKNMGDLAV